MLNFSFILVPIFIWFLSALDFFDWVKLSFLINTSSNEVLLLIILLCESFFGIIILGNEAKLFFEIMKEKFDSLLLFSFSWFTDIFLLYKKDEFERIWDLEESVNSIFQDNKNKNIGKNDFNIKNNFDNNQRKNKNFTNNYYVVKVKGIGNHIYAKELDEIFQSANYVTKKFFFNNNGQSRGYGYLNFNNLSDAQSAIDKFDNMIYKNSIFKLAFKNEKKIK